MIKFKCQCCGIEKEFKDADEAFTAGWDCPPYFSQIVVCDLCPASYVLIGKSHAAAHVHWETRGRPEEKTNDELSEVS